MQQPRPYGLVRVTFHRHRPMSPAGAPGPRPEASPRPETPRHLRAEGRLPRARRPPRALPPRARRPIAPAPRSPPGQGLRGWSDRRSLVGTHIYAGRPEKGPEGHFDLSRPPADTRHVATVGRIAIEGVEGGSSQSTRTTPASSLVRALLASSSVRHHRKDVERRPAPGSYFARSSWSVATGLWSRSSVQ